MDYQQPQGKVKAKEIIKICLRLYFYVIYSLLILWTIFGRENARLETVYGPPCTSGARHHRTEGLGYLLKVHKTYGHVCDGLQRMSPCDLITYVTHFHAPLDDSRQRKDQIEDSLQSA